MGISRLILASTLRPACILIFAGALLAGSPLMAEDAPVRRTASLTEDWAFRYGAENGPAALAGTVAGWPVVRLPHTWNAADGADGGGNHVRGAGWYVRRFQVDAAWSSRRVYIQFDGASRVATVYLNGKKIGTHAGCFARFRFDLTEALKFDGENLLAVEVNNADDGLAPVTADFTFFGGLYRKVHLFALDPLHVDVMDHAADGVFVTPDNVTAARADFSVAINVRNDSGRAAQAVIRTVVRDGQGAVVATQEQAQELAAHGAARIAQPFGLEHPHLWNGRQDPHQYEAEVSVLADGQVRDVVRQRFGLRSFRVDPDRGFFLNGAYLDLHGVSRHQDRAGKGWAISPEDEREDFAMIEEIGATAIRVAHYPQSALWYDLADERGLVVWAEIPVVNEVPATAVYAENAREQLRELIRQNYNRPAICFWGVGNETREADERSGKPAQVNGAASDRLIAELAELARTEDPARLSTYASHHRAEDTRNFHTDVLGFNKYFGWYGGTVGDFASWADETHRRFPALRFGLSEFGAGANIRQHELSGAKPAPGGEWHPEEYQAHYHEICWQALSARPYVWGKFVWNMFDFASDKRSEGAMPGINDKGLVTYDRRTRKDAFYFYKANWNPAPMLHIAGRRFAQRPAGSTSITVYSNAARVELLFNGVSHGTVASENRVFRWDVKLAAGDNRIAARAIDAPALTDECVITGAIKAATP
ncbi:glycoside hydrolase family 2 TIM barrel-domain containing protein [Opitutus sp. GAS368]|jgi:beta-galactosidase|uniref:glycoside hydrolase family 2 protein n=1 Tax=Opitutus sp. GAS368 TaxID=1882749 RepID=UPI00087D2DC8|nr:glycoside hydrolase family 2 TIM barrel-domain containing protein [Opitutus sp. GAS368]SDR67836.1 beta-galactosidase [Opitutus sp. GAS368]